MCVYVCMYIYVDIFVYVCICPATLKKSVCFDLFKYHFILGIFQKYLNYSPWVFRIGKVGSKGHSEAADFSCHHKWKPFCGCNLDCSLVVGTLVKAIQMSIGCLNTGGKIFMVSREGITECLHLLQHEGRQDQPTKHAAMG